MQKKLKRILLCTLLLAGSGFVRAADQEPDTSYTESIDVYDSLTESGANTNTGSGYESDEEYEEEARPPRVVIYNTQTPSEARWLEATSDDAYSYRTIREYVPRPAPPPRPEPAWVRFLTAVFLFFSSTAGKVILWSLLVLIVGYIAYRIIAGDGGLFGKRDLKPETAVDPGELSEEGLMELNWEARMREALAAGNERQAVRFGYLHLLQQLQARQLIQFRPDKTNIAYYRELGEGFRPGFRSLTRVYEFAWYGNFLPDATGMTDYVKQLEHFLQSAPRT
jgi:hypothetical protein